MNEWINRQWWMLAGLLTAVLTMAPAIGCAPSSIEQRTKTVSVHSDPEGAAVYHDGEKVGETPLEHEATYEVAKYENNTQYAVLSGLTSIGLFIGGLVGLVSGANKAREWNRHNCWTIASQDPECDNLTNGAAGKTFGGFGLLAGLTMIWPTVHFANRKESERRDESVEFRLSMRGHTDTVETLDFPDQRVVTANLQTTHDGSTSDGGSTVATANAAASSTAAGGEEAGAPLDSYVSVNPQPTAYALVVGIENYRDLPSPNGAATDAEQMARLFETSFGVPGDQIRVLTDDEATRADIQASLDWIRNNVSENGRIYLYFGGHGAPKPEEDASYLLPYEASTDNLSYTGLPLDGLVSSLRSSPAGDVVAFVDACFSGQGSRSVKREGTRPAVPTKMLNPGGKTVVYTASEADQISGPTDRGDRGLFTHHLLRALGSGRADVDGDGQISVGELDEYVTPRVERDATELSREQTPSMVIGESVETPADLILNWGLPTAE